MEDASILPMSLVLLKMQALEASKSFLTRIARNGIPCELEENVPVEKLFSGSALAEHEVEWAAEDQLDEVWGIPKDMAGAWWDNVPEPDTEEE